MSTVERLTHRSRAAAAAEQRDGLGSLETATPPPEKRIERDLSVEAWSLASD